MDKCIQNSILTNIIFNTSALKIFVFFSLTNVLIQQKRGCVKTDTPSFYVNIMISLLQ